MLRLVKKLLIFVQEAAENACPCRHEDGGPLLARDTDRRRLESSDLDCKGPALAILTGIT